MFAHLHYRATDDVMTVIEVGWFGGLWDTVAVLGALDLVLGSVAVLLLRRASSSDVQ